MMPVLDGTQPALGAHGPCRLLRGAEDGQRVNFDLHAALYPARVADEALVEEIERSGLRGRGGAAFPFSVKMRAVAGRRKRPVIVVNASEGEPLSRKDDALLSVVPHLILDGAQASARALGAAEIVIGLRRGPTSGRASLLKALEERRNGRRRETDVRILDVPDRYVSGEASALVNLINGGQAIPTGPDPRPDERGVRRRPTLLSNAETFAHVGLIASHGGEWFREVGSPEDPGTRLLTVLPPRGPVTVVEVPSGARAGDVLRAEWSQDSDYVLVGGYAGTWMRVQDLLHSSLASPARGAAGISLGVGLLAFLPRGACVIAETSAIARWMAGESARQCGPCVNGLPAIAEALEALTVGGFTDIGRLEAWCGMVTGRGLCHHPGGVARTVRTALETCPLDVHEHTQGHPCTGSGAVRFIPIPQPATGAEERWR